MTNIIRIRIHSYIENDVEYFCLKNTEVGNYIIINQVLMLSDILCIQQHIFVPEYFVNGMI